ncbi:MerR family transcriptional regulator [Cryobacterium arcticum]|uniref:MerR family transcriptional regulator n=1 Tax=Cryobacterium arcticum TaxID=670052 RepID=A0A317ZQX3_9MICO|nr:TipAS antibiotic-recognition domain-containing protein [Cryobacterium arcticum]PXA67145.1 MerR family transcriptional regulator [Cryobacterium arcticum]
MSPAHEWSIQEIARLAGTTRRTLRHYQDMGLVSPSRIGDNGYRYYDAEALVRLQRVLLLRQLGLGLPAIGDVIAGQRDDVAALRAHLDWLAHEQQRLGRQMASVERTITELEKGEKPMAEKMFDGFDHTAYKDEVERLWGTESYAESDAWYQSLTQDEKDDFLLAAAELGAEWAAAAQNEVAADSDDAQALAQRHYAWLQSIPGTPRTPEGNPTKEYFRWMGEMSLADERLAQIYGGTAGAALVNEAIAVYADRNL